MPLEATMMIIDNSEYMRNGDYQPTRFEAQSDAVNVIFQTKTDSNPESTIGVMTMAGPGPEVLVTNTKDLGQVLQGLHRASLKIGGEIDIPTAIAVAQLALKHRENKNLRQRIMVFVGSPLQGEAADEKAMIRLAKKLKKNNVAVDMICFGDGIEEEGQGLGEGGRSVLKTFVETVNSNDNSHMVTIPPGSALLSDCIMSSSVLAADRGALIPEELRMGEDGAPGGSGGAGGSGGDFEFGVDPSLDPELAMALRLSMQEAQAREAAETAAASSSNAQAQSSSSSAPAAAAAGGAAAGAAAAATAAASSTADEDTEMDPELAKALAMSEQKDVEMEDEEEDEDAAIARAIEMSMQEEEEDDKKKS
ncbi:ubiquitin interaction domain-containing protein family protein [Coprinopsis cinerea okayama7|uniref:Ubiquitin interaction domain-containing protein family protein n=1 Tax=Coprinopsis cinerea (strain Okayama-7 / 130 / ATCC MYA-4618 / FGSC 9003) TaxID=240176 RepID=A8P7I4_COPC7|nr:ubiquitin interaction domain-containing protein family protein [Coprinopsis cinerea okayama7\|eukprot:XP_001839367.1 ubiquitin interaction domain-containing protein family protein [Coprinopsis cinerea okayama7\